MQRPRLTTFDQLVAQVVSDYASAAFGIASVRTRVIYCAAAWRARRLPFDRTKSRLGNEAYAFVSGSAISRLLKKSFAFGDEA
jgi:hypothetical protein